MPLPAVPEWAPPGENHILYSEGILKKVEYGSDRVAYTATKTRDTEYLRLAFRPETITLNGKPLPLPAGAEGEAYSLRSLGKGDYALNHPAKQSRRVVIEY